jgi:hypothetical protein
MNQLLLIERQRNCQRHPIMKESPHVVYANGLDGGLEQLRVMFPAGLIEPESHLALSFA